MDVDLPYRVGRRSITGMDAPRKSISPTPGQIALAEKLARGETFMADDVVTLSVDRYVDETRHDAEKKLLEGMATPLVPSTLLAEPGSALAHDDSGRALLITRDQHGKARIFANACAHRGTRLLDAGDVVEGRKIACPYHAWVYNLEGALVGFPRPDAFPGLCKDDHGLVEYGAAEQGGLIWFSPDTQADFAVAQQLADDFDAIGLGEMRFFQRGTHRIAANWKLVIDAFLESYHVKRLHQGSIGEFFADGMATADCIGRHQRFAVGRVDYDRKIDPTDWSQLRETVTLTYHIFPNGVLVLSPDYCNVMMVHPGKDARSCRAENFMLVPGDTDPSLFSDKWERSWQLLDKGTFGGEDFRAAALCQQGIDSGVRKEMIIGRLEAGITQFHDQLDELLQARS